MRNEPQPVAPRFCAGYVVDPGTGCWLWMRAKDRHGYGHISVQGKTKLAHRVGYELLRGPIPEGMTMDHLCRNRSCVNPDHLEPVPHRTNVLRGMAPSAEHARKTHCIHGHEFTPENTYVHQGKRSCRECYRAKHRRKSQRLRAEKEAS